MNKTKSKLEQLEAVVCRRQDDLFRFAYMRLGNRADAEDAVQDVFLRLFRSDEDLTRVADVERYLFRAMLLDPQALLSREESQALANRRAKYVKRVDGDAVVLTVEVPAEGEFVHGVGRNTSVSESDTRREYRFDRGSGRLTGMKIDMLDGGAATTVVELKNIAYDIEVDASLFTHPEDGIAWTDLTKPVGSDLFVGITPELAVDKMFAAMRTWDSAVLEQIITFVPVDRFEKYKGCMLVESGDHFRSGDYAGVFVPCKVKFADGSTEKLLVALRNDNAKGAWVLDGGM